MSSSTIAPWRTAEAEAHETKADALEHAAATVAGVLPMLEPTARLLVTPALAALEEAARRHESQAALARGRAA